MPDWVADDFVALPALDAAVVAAFDGNSRQQAWTNTLVNLFTGAFIRLMQDGVLVADIPVGTPTIAGANVTFPPNTVTITTSGSFDLRTGVWRGYLVKGGANLFAASVGRTTGVIRVAANTATPDIIPFGTLSVSIGPVVVTAPPFVASSGNTGGAGTSTFVAGAPPGTGWTTALTAAQTPVVLPANFYGWHRWGNQGAANYGYAIDRSWDYISSTGLPVATCWALAHTGPNQFDWTGIQDWINNSPGKFRVYTMALTPRWATAQLYPVSDINFKYEDFPNGILPPTDMALVDQFVTALKNRFGTNIHAIEVLNEPNTYDDGNPDVRATDRGVRPEDVFANFTMREQVIMGKRVQLNKHPSWQVWAGAWEGQGRWHNQAGLFVGTPDHVGGIGADHVDALTFHPYMFNYDSDTVFEEATALRSVLQQRAAALGRPEIANIPIICSEIGHESPGLAQNTSVANAARIHRQSVGWALISACVAGLKGTIFYQDRTSDQRTAYAPVNNYPEMIAVANYCHQAVNGGKTIRQAAYRRDNSGDQVWVRFSDNTEFIG